MGLIITLIVLGIILIIVELVLIPGIFVVGILGLASLVGSCYIGFSEYGNTGGVIVIAVNIILLVVFVVLALRSKTWKKISLDTNIDSRADTSPQEKGVEVGSEGVTITRLNPMGKAKIGTVFLEVSAQGGIIDPEQEIVVTLIDDNKIYVKLKN